MSNDEHSADENASDEHAPDERRRRLLGYAALSVLAGSGCVGAWYATRPDEEEESPSVETPATTTARTTDDTTTTGPVDEAPALVRRYAPDLYFGRLERWYPTDPRSYVVETDDGPVVDGFTALDGYTAAFAESGSPPDPTVFYNVVEAADGVDAIQYWLYSVFDQFTVNFHWHDWELLQVFVDRETGRPLLLSASAHARSVPNNEFLDPSLPNGRRPGVLSEVGSHSSASELNEVAPSFERLDTDDWHSDVSNGLVDITPDLTAPLAYGLPRDEGARLPFVMPTLDGRRLDEHPALSVGREAFVDESVTVDAWHGLPQPPATLPLREPGLVLTHPDSPTTADAAYELEPMEVVRDAVDDFVGPQLRFEFAIPDFVEDQFASHTTSVGIPWEQPRFTDPLDDVTDTTHRQRLDGRVPSGLANRVVGRVRQLRSGVGGTLERVSEEAGDALADAATVSLAGLPVELAVRLASEHPVASVTRSGAFAFLHVEPGEHLLAVNGPGVAPVAERFVHEDGLERAGADGDLTVVANEDAAWIRGDGRAGTGIDRVRVTEDYAGVVYDGRPAAADRFAVAVHREGRYTVEVVDRDGRPGGFRVGPPEFEGDGEAVREVVETGKAALVRTLADVLADLLDLARTLAERDRAEREVVGRLSLALELAHGAASAVEREDPRRANDGLSRLTSTLEVALEILQGDGQDGFSDASAAALDPRIREAIQRAREATRTDLA